MEINKATNDDTKILYKTMFSFNKMLFIDKLLHNLFITCIILLYIALRYFYFNISKTC